jgi:hypothetical protein
MGRRIPSRAAGHSLGGERLPGPHRQMVPTCRDRCRPVPTCRYGGGGVRPHDFQGKTTYNGPTDAGQTPPYSTMAPLPALALGRPPQCPHAGRHRHVHHRVCWLAQYWDTQTMTGRTWSARQVRGRRRWTTRPAPPGAIGSWTRLAAGESVMTAGDASVCVVEEDAPLRASLPHRLRSGGLRVAACTSALRGCPATRDAVRRDYDRIWSPLVGSWHIEERMDLPRMRDPGGKDRVG